ncbi:hypothetical protein HK099_002536, partial [Clydaea vesicula]
SLKSKDIKARIEKETEKNLNISNLYSKPIDFENKTNLDKKHFSQQYNGLSSDDNYSERNNKLDNLNSKDSNSFYSSSYNSEIQNDSNIRLFENKKNIASYDPAKFPFSVSNLIKSNNNFFDNTNSQNELSDDQRTFFSTSLYPTHPLKDFKDPTRSLNEFGDPKHLARSPEQSIYETSSTHEVHHQGYPSKKKKFSSSLLPSRYCPYNLHQISKDTASKDTSNSQLLTYSDNNSRQKNNFEFCEDTTELNMILRKPTTPRETDFEKRRTVALKNEKVSFDCIIKANTTLISNQEDSSSTKITEKYGKNISNKLKNLNKLSLKLQPKQRGLKFISYNNRFEIPQQKTKTELNSSMPQKIKFHEVNIDALVKKYYTKSDLVDEGKKSNNSTNKADLISKTTPTTTRNLTTEQEKKMECLKFQQPLQTCNKCDLKFQCPSELTEHFNNKHLTKRSSEIKFSQNGKPFAIKPTCASYMTNRASITKTELTCRRCLVGTECSLHSPY